MSNGSSPDKTAPGKNLGANRGLAWIVQGWRLVQEQPALWFGMAAIYLVLGFTLKLIPFMGDLLLVLITPMLLAGVVAGLAREKNTVHQNVIGKASSMPALFQAWLAQPAQELVSIFIEEDKVFGAVLLGIVTLGLGVLVKITGYLLIGGSMVSGLTAGQLNASQIMTVLGMLVVAILYLVLSMGLLYSVPRTVLGNRPPFEAIAESFTACRHNAVPLLTQAAPFFVVYLGIIAVFANNHWLGYLLVFSAGGIALPVFVASFYCSYLALFPSDHSASPQ
ncbi:hypothetical protein [Sulfuricaulis sp.]|jgi:hypothetical protein|uniref:hypothetical protein n=1 Tax=Sulfuricaulis sp. TaxID=2003553 RepID=UPI0035593DD9